MTKKYCNLCGSRFNYWDANEGYSIHKMCGYGSKNDGSYMELDICCKCMDTLVEQCAITPLVTDIDDGFTGDTEEVFNED